MIEKTKNFLTPMTLESIKSHIKKDKKGFHEVEFISGNPITLEHGVLYVTTKMSYRFNVNYAKMKPIRVANAIYKSVTSDQVSDCRKMYTLLSKEQQSCMLASAIKELEDKEEKILKGVPLTITERPSKTHGTHDISCPNIIHYDDKSDGVMLFKSFQYNIHKREYRIPETHYYFDNGENIKELNTTDPIVAKALEKAKVTSRKLAGKDLTSKPSLVYTPKVSHILTIDGDK